MVLFADSCTKEILPIIRPDSDGSILNFSSKILGAKAESPAMMMVSAAPPKFSTTYVGFFNCVYEKYIKGIHDLFNYKKGF